MIDPHELIFAVDEQNRPLAPVTRLEAHQTGVWHRTSHIWVHNGKGQLLCQQRSLLKENFPGQWEAFFGGHMPPDVNPEEGALLELEEEIGLRPNAEELKFYGIEKMQERVRGRINNEVIYVYTCHWEGEAAGLTPEEDEISQVKWFPIEEVEAQVGQADSVWTQVPYASRLLEKVRSYA